MAKSTRDLVARLQAGDQSAWFELWQVFGPMIERWVGRLAGGSFSAETVRDVGQETLARVAQEVRRFDPDRGARFSTWLFGVTRFIVLTELTRRNAEKRGSGKRGVSLEALLNEPASSGSAPPEEYERAALRSKVYWAIQVAARAADLLEFEAYRLIVIEGQQGKVVAPALGVSEPTISRYHRRFRERLREAVRTVLAEYSFNDAEAGDSLAASGLATGDDRLFDEAVSHVYLSESEARQGFDRLTATAQTAWGKA